MRHRRRTCAKLCDTSGGELEQIQFLLGHASVQTTERYLGCKQNLGHPVNDLFNLGTSYTPHGPGAQPGAATPLEVTPGQALECPHGGYAQPDAYLVLQPRATLLLTGPSEEEAHNAMKPKPTANQTHHVERRTSSCLTSHATPSAPTVARIC